MLAQRSWCIVQLNLHNEPTSEREATMNAMQIENESLRRQLDEAHATLRWHGISSTVEVSREDLTALIDDFASTCVLLANAYSRLSAMGDDTICTYDSEQFEEQRDFEIGIMHDNHPSLAQFASASS